MVGSGGPANGTIIYIAIRRGPMKVPTTGTSVFAANRYQYNSGYAGGLTTTTVSGAAGGFGGFPTDLVINTIRNQSGDTNRQFFLDRLRGITGLWSTQTFAESSPGAPGSDAKWDNMVGVTTSGYPYYVFTPYIFTNFFFRRAPGFFDEVCYTGTGSGTTVVHNLAAVPELIITKRRNSTSNWGAYHSFTPTQNGYNYLDLDGAGFNANYGTSSRAFQSQPTSTQFVTGGQAQIDTSGGTYVAYLFASCPGVSKVGSYTGNGSSQTINCGFTGGARFVMIKRTDSTGDWYVWDTVDGIVAGNDPYIALNTTAAEVTSNDTIDTDSTGFVVNQVSATNVNVSSATYIFLAIA
jgi:hypothetical protein